jgi:hypothetical protein
MTPSQVRTELLRQHEEIRLMIETTREAARRAWTSAWSRSDLSACTLRLAHFVRAHNLHEEELLRGLLRTVDAWGPVRVEIMDAHHAHEHRHLVAALIEASAALDSIRVDDALIGRLDQLLEHMAQEEKLLLTEEVLRDDCVAIDQVDG